jgi:hypothetical protein
MVTEGGIAVRGGAGCAGGSVFIHDPDGFLFELMQPATAPAAKL